MCRLQPLLERLRDDFFIRNVASATDGLHPFNRLSDEEKKLLIKTYKNLPPRGDFDIRQVLDSTYFFS